MNLLFVLFLFLVVAHANVYSSPYELGCAVIALIIRSQAIALNLKGSSTFGPFTSSMYNSVNGKDTDDVLDIVLALLDGKNSDFVVTLDKTIKYSMDDIISSINKYNENLFSQFSDDSSLNAELKAKLFSSGFDVSNLYPKKASLSIGEKFLTMITTAAQFDRKGLKSKYSSTLQSYSAKVVETRNSELVRFLQNRKDDCFLKNGNPCSDIYEIDDGKFKLKGDLNPTVFFKNAGEMTRNGVRFTLDASHVQLIIGFDRASNEIAKFCAS